MSLYDDIDTDKKVENVSGWASGIKFLQNHMQLKKAALTQPKRDVTRKQTTRLAPVIDLNKSKGGNNRDDPDDPTGSGGGNMTFVMPYSTTTTLSKTDKKTNKTTTISNYLCVDLEWQFDNEYDPVYPNDYEKALKEMRDRRDREAEEDELKRKTQDDREEEEIINFPSTPSSKSSGAAIAPPPSLASVFEDVSTESPGGNFGLGVGSGASAAARIMAKYGYKEGQGLGRKEQGMATALQVEKISHRTGRIIHEKDTPKNLLLNSLGIGFGTGTTSTPPNLAASYMDDELEPEPEPEAEAVVVQPPVPTPEPEKTMSELLRNPSKVVLLKNMVGPGEVDDDLEPEVKEECLKYGEVHTVTVFQMPDVDSEEAIRIFVEFKRVESAIKAVVDLNGRFFGGRQVKALFYLVEKYNNLELTD